MNKGMSFIELLITLAIVTILISIAYPSYQHYLTRTRRVAAKAGLLQLAARLENYYANHHSYAGAASQIPATLTEHGWYRLRIATASAAGYQLEAIPQRSQSADAACGRFYYDQLGDKKVSGTQSAFECWG
jgi:type IV pilus assembly protein PilE